VVERDPQDAFRYRHFVHNKSDKLYQIIAGVEARNENYL
jgi:hypothetical protein